jgi:hypothetical protein
MRKWYYLVGDREVGPIEAAQLKQLADAGRLASLDKVRRDDMFEWYQAKQIRGLFEIPDVASAVRQPSSYGRCTNLPFTTRPQRPK